MYDYIKTTGIVVKRTNYKDADKILTILTPDLGKISGKAKGIRKISSSQRSHLEPGSVATIYLIKSKDHYIVTQANSIQNVKITSSNYDSAAMIYALLEITDKLIPDNDPNEVNFELLKKTLQLFEKYPYIGLVLAYIIKLLKINGYYTYGDFKVYQLDASIMNRIQLLETAKLEQITESDNDYWNPVAKPILNYLREKTDITIKSFSVN